MQGRVNFLCVCAESFVRLEALCEKLRFSRFSHLAALLLDARVRIHSPHSLILEKETCLEKATAHSLLSCR